MTVNILVFPIHFGRRQGTHLVVVLVLVTVNVVVSETVAVTVTGYGVTVTVLGIVTESIMVATVVKLAV